MKMIKNKKAFTLIELIVTIAVLGVLVLLASPRFFGYTQNAELTRGFANAKSIEKASELYYMDNNDWPRLTDEPYTSEEIKSYSERILNHTGHEVNLDPEGNYYDIDYDKLSDYVQVPDDKKNYILQNPVGKIYYMENLNEVGIARVNYSNVEEEDTFEFTATFTNAGSTGRTGPTQSQLDSAYAGTILEGLVSSQNGIQLWTVPESGKYRIETYGAQGGNDENGVVGGFGAIMKGNFQLQQGQVVNLIIGQKGTDGVKDAYNRAGAGGGGSFAWLNTSETLLISAGGGGGAFKNSPIPASISQNGNNGSNLGGLNGNGGIGGTAKNSTDGGGGGGWLSSGTGVGAGTKILNSSAAGGANNRNGGFGGGGGSTNSAGGGGGYSGGGGGANSGGVHAGGGGSYNSGANQANSVGNTGHGKVIITYIGK